MKAVVFSGKRKMQLETRETPTPGPGELLLEVKACGISGTDQHIYQGGSDASAAHPPVVLGREFSGVVTARGDGVTALQIGERVCVDPNLSCGYCPYCRDGYGHLCRKPRTIGVTEDGGMATHVIVPARQADRLPDELSFEEGALVEPLGCVLHGLDLLRLAPDASVLIIGGGCIGQMFIQLISRLGAGELWVSEPDEKKRASCRRWGATDTLDPSSKEALDRFRRRWTDGFDVVIECVGRQETAQQAIDCAGHGGQVLLFGVAAIETRISLSPYEVFRKELTIRGSYNSPHTRRQAIALIREGKVRVQPLVSHRFALERLPEIMAVYPSMNATKGIILC